MQILGKLGITGIKGWFLSDQVVPVALVDSEVTLNASSTTPLVNVPASAGEQVAPAANFRLATTGPLPAGPYTMVFWIGTSEANGFRIRRRNAADAADVWSFRLNTGVTNGPGFINIALRLVLNVNELVVIENVTVGGAGTAYQASIFVSAG